MLYVWIAWAWVKSIWQVTLAPLLAKVPWQVWAGLASVVVVLYYGHVKEQKGIAKCQAQVEIAKNAEIQRQANVAAGAIANAKNEEAQAKQEAAILKGRLDNALQDISKLKDANKVCVPKSITDQFRGVRKPRR